MNRILRIIVHNWPLKIAAIALSTVLYGGIVLSEGARDFPGQIPIRPENLAEDMYVLDQPPSVTNVRYFAPAGVDQPSTDTFRASIDYSAVGEEGGTFNFPVTVTSINPQIRVIEVTPNSVPVTIEPIISKIVPVRIERGEIPTGLGIGVPRSDPSTVMVRGPRSRVDIVIAALATVSIQRGGLDVDQDVTLIPVDRLGEARSPVDVSPATARIQVQVFSAPSSRTLKINPVVTGTAAAGFEIDTVTVEPQTALVEGDEDALEATASLDTEPLSISGRSETATFETVLALPDGIEQIEQDPITVTVTFRAVTESRTYIAGLAATGGPPNARYEFSSDRVQLVVGGSPPDLDALTAADGPVGTVDVTGLGPGTYDLEVSADLPAGLTLVAAIPSTVSVTISTPDAEAPSSTATASPTGS